MASEHQDMKDLYIDYYMETRNQERLIASGYYGKVHESIDRRQTIIEKINSLDSSVLRVKGGDIEVIIQRTIKLEKKNGIMMSAAMVDQRIKMKSHKIKRNNIMRYSVNK